MKSPILLLALIVVALSSCTTAFKTGQTPDDVYFSPTRPADEYVRTERDDRRYQSRDEYYDDRYLRMRVNNRTRWSELDDWYYYGSRYDYSYYNSYNWNNPWTPCSYWNSYYNPYYQSYVVVKPKSPVFNRPRMSNLNTYNNNMLTNNNYSNPKTSRGGFKIFSNSGNSNSYSGGSGSNGRSSGNGSGTGNFLRNIFNGNNSSSGNNSNSSSNSSSGSRTSSSSSSGSSSSGSSGSGSAPVRRF